MEKKMLFVPKYLDKAGLYNFSRENFPELSFSANAAIETALKKLSDICKEKDIELEIEPRDIEIPAIKVKETKIYNLNTQVMCGDRSVLSAGTRIRESHKDFKEFLKRGLLETTDLSDYID